MPASVSLFPELECSPVVGGGANGGSVIVGGGSGVGLGDERALALAFELSMLELCASTNSNNGMSGNCGGTISNGNGLESHPATPSPLNDVADMVLEELRLKKSQNMTECVPVPSSEHVAEIVGRQGCKIKALRAKTNTYIKTPVRGDEPVFVVTGRKEDVAKAKREILSAAEHFSQIRASRKNNLAGLNTAVAGLNLVNGLGLASGAAGNEGSTGSLNGTATPPGGVSGSSAGLLPPTNIPGHVTIQVRVPYRVVGLVVGPKGATIKRIQHQTHTYIVTPSRDKDPVFEVTGLPDSVETARREIEAHIAVRTGNGTSINGLPNTTNNHSNGNSNNTTPESRDEKNVLHKMLDGEAIFEGLFKGTVDTIMHNVDEQILRTAALNLDELTLHSILAALNALKNNERLSLIESGSSNSSSRSASTGSDNLNSQNNASLGGNSTLTLSGLCDSLLGGHNIWSTGSGTSSGATTASPEDCLSESPNFDAALSNIWTYPSNSNINGISGSSATNISTNEILAASLGFGCLSTNIVDGSGADASPPESPPSNSNTSPVKNTQRVF